jgi:SNF2-related domain/Helicase conserved C-terminal domain
MSTIFHSNYYAHALTRRFSSEKLEKLSQSLFNATVDLNPHQIEAALFAFRSPLSRGAILADEVGLGKTIEAGLIISQLWAERKRRILIILPAALRQQWSQELLEKFFIESLILESKNFNQLIKQGSENPFDQTDTIVLCSYHFARAKSEDIIKVPWDLVVVDEAHRLRNVYRKDNKIARTLLAAIGNRPKVLLTATPLQNSLMELYGLVSFIDPHLFGSEDSFRSQYARRASEMSREEFQVLRARVQPVCHRTLRRQVVEYIRYTNRIPITQDFTPSAEEERLYNAVSAYLQREESYALPSGQRALMTLVLRKILASSSFAIANTLGSMVHRLETQIARAGGESLLPMTEVLAEDYESIAETQEEWEPSDSSDNGDEDVPPAKPAHAIRQEAAELRQYKTLAESITHNAKGEALLLALKKGFEKAAQLGAPSKALIFTESRRTQRYLKELLQTNGYAGSIVTLNGTNNDPDALHIYRDWLQRHAVQDVLTGSKSVDIRTALVEEFRERAAIMIATESGAEGINLQFCSLVVNYDLPWNPQRIEQRIGRCHRYGQKHDVVVINFLNRKNAADQRVFELLSEKFRLFDGVFGASDEVLGAIESGVDFEKRIHEIYQSSRTPEEIARAFDQLQLELEEQITSQLQDTRAKLLENFDADVHTRLRLNQDQTTQQITRFEEWLWRLTQRELDDCAFFDPNGYTFNLKRLPDGIQSDGIALGQYRLITHKNGTEAHHFRLGHPLAEHVLAQAKGRTLPVAEVTFRYDQHRALNRPRMSLVEQLQDHAGWLRLSLLTIEALEPEQHLVFSAIDDDDNSLGEETCERVFMIAGEVGKERNVPETVQTLLDDQFETKKAQIVQDVTKRNQTYFEAEMDKLENWAEDLKQGLERELKELDREIKSTKKEARQASSLDTKVALHKKAKELERQRNDKRRRLFETQDEVDERKDSLIEDIEQRLKQRMEDVALFTIRWCVR